MQLFIFYIDLTYQIKKFYTSYRAVAKQIVLLDCHFAKKTIYRSTLF